MTAGQPPKYKTPEEMQVKIDSYFADESQTHTISGLALYLGFCDRQSLRDYSLTNSDSDKFSCIIKAAISKIGSNMEAALQKSAGQVAGPIFWLKNHGWNDEQGLNIKGSLSLVDVAAKMGINE
jgi:hypothetical protein